MKQVLFAVVIAFATKGIANTTCSDSTGSTRIVRTVYDGGAAPMPGFQIGETKIYVNSELLSESRYFSGGKATRGPLEASFDQSTLHEFIFKTDGTSTLNVYGELVTIYDTNGSKTMPINPISVYMMCTNKKRYLP